MAATQVEVHNLHCYPAAVPYMLQGVTKTDLYQCFIIISITSGNIYAIFTAVPLILVHILYCHHSRISTLVPRILSSVVAIL